MNFTKTFSTDAAVHHGFFVKNLMGVINNNVNIELFETLDETIEPANILEINSEVLHPYHKADSSSKSGRYVTIYIKDKNRGVVLKFDEATKNYAKLFYLSWCKSGIECTAFSSDEKILVVGGADGKIYLYSIEFKKLLEIISINNEYISSVSISRNNNLVAFSSFKKNLDIYDLGNNMLSTRHVHNEVITVCEFMHKSNFIIFGARDTNIVLYDFISDSVHKELGKTSAWPVSILIEDDDSFCLISDKSGHVFFIDLYNIDSEQEILFHKSGNVVVNMKKDDKKFIFFHENGDINIFDTDVEMIKVEEAFNDKNYEKFFKLTAENPILKFKGKELYENSHEEFEKELEKAIINISMGEVEAAKKIMRPFIGIEKNKAIFNFYVLNAAKIEKYSQIVDNHEYSKAYALAGSAAYYKKLPKYKDLEEEFVQTFNMAELILVEDERNIQKAQKALQHFLAVPEKKNVISALFKAPKIFHGLDKLFEEQKLISFHKKVVDFPAVKAAPVYEEFSREVNRRISKFLKAEKDKKYDDAFSLSLALKKDIPEDFLQPLLPEFDRIKHIKEFARAINAKKFKPAINLASKYPFLISLDEYSILEEFLNKHFNMAIRYAYAGKIQGVHKYLDKFLTIDYTKQRTIKIYKLAYVQQISGLGSKMNDSHWKSTLMRYVTRFGTDAEIEIIAKRFDVDELLERLSEVKKTDFEKLPLLINIVSGK